MQFRAPTESSAVEDPFSGAPSRSDSPDDGFDVRHEALAVVSDGKVFLDPLAGVHAHFPAGVPVFIEPEKAFF
jgi:hypothetical protein